MVSLNPINRLRNWKLGAITGLNQTENNIKMTATLCVPFLVMWLFIKMFLPDAMYDTYLSFAFGIWLVWIVMLWAYAKSDAGNYIVFPQSHWRFPDGSSRTFDIKIPPDSWEKIAEFPDGTVGYKVRFLDKYLYDDPDLSYSIVFQMAYWNLPKLWDTSFQRRAFGEFFHKGVFVQKPDCEDISVYVRGWETDPDGNILPVCIINDCTATYENVMANAGLEIEMGEGLDQKSIYTLYTGERKSKAKLQQHSRFLEQRVEVAEKDHSEDYKDSADKRLENVRKRHGRVMDVKVSWKSRIFNLETLAYVLIVVTLVFLFGRVVMRWW